VVFKLSPDSSGGTRGEWDHARNADRIAGTASNPYVRNSTDSYMANAASVEVTFEIAAKVERDMSAALAASRANLLKVSKARWPQQKPLYTRVETSTSDGDPDALLANSSAILSILW
jgi:hypothetical protein